VLYLIRDGGELGFSASSVLFYSPGGGLASRSVLWFDILDTPFCDLTRSVGDGCFDSLVVWILKSSERSLRSLEMRIHRDSGIWFGLGQASGFIQSFSSKLQPCPAFSAICTLNSQLPSE
jgi:hypothetical protein